MRILIDGQTLSTGELSRGIGKVFLEILYRLIDGEIRNDWFIAVRRSEDLEKVKPNFRRWVRPIVLPELGAEGAQVYWCRAYGNQLTEVAKNIEADLYWNPNPLMPNVHFPLGFRAIPRVATVYDLIPRVMPELYRATLGEALWEDYCVRCEELGSGEWNLAAISSATANDIIKAYPKAQRSTRVIPLGGNFTTFWPYVQGDRLSDPPYVLFLGGFDPRKNMDNALRAFAAFSKSDVDARVRFKVACAYDSASRERYLKLAAELGVQERLDLPGYVDETQLGFLFRGASVFFFPSLYEGFGLPVLDALACGVRVVASRVSSIPEVGGEHAVYCDPTDVADMARALRTAWGERDPFSPGRYASVEHARTFRWGNSAQSYIRCFTSVVEERSANIAGRPTSRPRIAYLSPWPPQRTGVADYSYLLIPELKARAEITVFVEKPEECVPVAGVEIRSIDDYPSEGENFDGIIYQLGNGLTHRKIYEHAWRYPGIIVLHDYNIHPFLQHAYANTPEEWLYEQALREYGPEGERAWDRYKETGTWPDVWRFPLSHPITRRSRAAIVHSRWVAEQLGGIGRVLRVHHGAELVRQSGSSPSDDLQREFGLSSDYFWIGVFGFVNQHKRLDSMMAAVRRLRQDGYPARLLIVGEVNDARVDLAKLIDSHDLAGAVRHEGYVDPDLLLRFMEAVDVVANLRYPTMGESSGSLFRAMSLGKPVIVSDVAAFAEIPDSVALKAVPGEREIDELTLCLKSLLSSARVRTAAGNNAKAFIEHWATFGMVADTYVAAVMSSSSAWSR